MMRHFSFGNLSSSKNIFFFFTNLDNISTLSIFNTAWLNKLFDFTVFDIDVVIVYSFVNFIFGYLNYDKILQKFLLREI